MEKILVFGHKNPDTDSICSSVIMANLVNKLGKEAEAVRLGSLNDETKYVFDYLKMEPTREISSVEDGQDIILVDHNELAQSVDNRDNANILAVVDHHRIADFKTINPLYYIAKPYGCTATILYGLYKENNVEIDREIAILMLSAITSDTLLLKSPTCTSHDVEAFNELEKIAGIDAKTYGLEMLKAGTDTSKYSAEELINLDAKEVNEKGKKFIVAQVNTIEIDDVFSRREEIEFAMEKEINDKKVDVMVFLITDIVNSNSKAIVLGNDKEIAEKAFDKKLDENDSMMLEGVVSRKKQVLPKLLASID